MKEIELTQGYTAIVDDEDYERVSQYNWCFSDGVITTYDWKVKDGSTFCLNRFVLAITDAKQKVTFVNGDHLDNRKSNLRVTTQSIAIQRAAPTQKRRKTSRYKGVSRHRDKWIVKIGWQGKSLYLGVFENEEKAAYAYDKAAEELYGSLAYLNLTDQSLERVEHSTLPVRSGVRKCKAAVTSQFKGVHYSHHNGWRIVFQINGERIERYAKTEMEAAHIYDELIIKHLGSNARSNFESIHSWKRRESANRNQHEPAHKAGF